MTPFAPYMDEQSGSFLFLLAPKFPNDWWYESLASVQERHQHWLPDCPLRRTTPTIVEADVRSGTLPHTISYVFDKDKLIGLSMSTSMPARFGLAYLDALDTDWGQGVVLDAEILDDPAFQAPFNLAPLQPVTRHGRWYVIGDSHVRVMLYLSTQADVALVSLTIYQPNDPRLPKP